MAEVEKDEEHGGLNLKGKPLLFSGKLRVYSLSTANDAYRCDRVHRARYLVAILLKYGNLSGFLSIGCCN